MNLLPLQPGPAAYSLDGRRYVVGGGTRGLGFAVARELISAGADVLLISRDPDHLADAQRQLGDSAHIHAADLSAAGEHEATTRAIQMFCPDGLDGTLINSGGPPRGRALELDDDTWQSAFELLLGGPIRLVRSLRPLLRDGSSLLIIASSSVRELVPNLDISNVLRPAVAALTRVLARDLAPGVRVNTLAPGRFATERANEADQLRATAEGLAISDVRARAAAMIPLGRYGDPAELGRVGAFLLSPAASYITGATIHVDGGIVSSAP